MIILGIESSCDETAVSVVKDGRTVLSNVIASQIEEHRLYGGVVPEIASRRHSEAIVGVAKEAIKNANITLDDVDAVAVTYAPGLIGALLVGVNFAKGIALSKDIPLIPVHHLRGHIASNYLDETALKPPFLCLVVSGGHSHIIEVSSYTELKVIARTRDDAAGEAFDKAARSMGIPYPGGVKLDEIAETGDPNSYKLPTPRVANSPLDFSFSGLKTAVINLIHNSEQKGESVDVPNLCASYRKTLVDSLVKNFLKCAEQTGHKTLVVAGGVSANRLLRRELTQKCADLGLTLYQPALKYCGDNAAMIASQGYYEFMAGNMTDMSLNACARKDISE